MTKFVQMMLTPDNPLWQGRLIALDENGAIYEVGEKQEWRWIAGTRPKPKPTRKPSKKGEL